MAGYVRILIWNGSEWMPMGNDISCYEIKGEFSLSGDYFGFSVSLNYSGDVVVIGCPFGKINTDIKGYISIHEWTGSCWEQKGPSIKGELNGD